VRARATVLLAALVGAVGCSGGDDPSTPAVSRPPVVILVFDEFPGDALLGPDGGIDAERFPNFAALAGMSTWFPNGHTVFDSTFSSVPAILDGRLPRPRTAPDVRSHQPSIFHLMDELGYEIVKVESATAVCPPRVCIGARARRPSVLDRLAGGGRPERLHGWMGAIRRRSRPAFYFQHTLLPHEPWIYLPSGRHSRPTGKDPIASVNRWVGFHDARLTEHNHMRHLLQVGYVDHELGRLLRRLRRTGLLRRSLLIVAADHGYSFDVGVRTRRKVSETNVEEIAPVPFFVKAPGQLEGAVDDSLVRTVDITPTVADLLGVRVDWPHDGRSAFSAATQNRDEVRIPTRTYGRTIMIGREELERRRRAVRIARARTFGTGVQSSLLFGDPWATVYRVGPNTELLDRRVDELRIRRPGRVSVAAGAHGGPGGGVPVANGQSARAAVAVASPRSRVAIANARLVRRVTFAGELVPTRVAGTLGRGRPGTTRDLAVAVNGRIRAVGRSFRLRFRRAEYFSLLVPEDSLRRGRNVIELFEVEAGGRLDPLARIS
jgi:Sulfatase